ncbi:MAG: GNAT family N-acetyltransferase [Chloroflexi bacterium]|uniref:GNAT family N-acetyltransferase n=1 Tax=Candidatus Chlorohelix allophototropha TaxID=3003348 RepID=A0A8T7LUF6_9CHLR|nr:GNAT family N-acetyltransferase [Chloroflexota bacterium]WJW66380.1 GNAT family N-acetyltransferase [Chloroflexota bacterium L227-S17]
MFQEYHNGEYIISTDPAKQDAVAIQAYLSRSYWAEGIPLEIVEKSLLNSLCFGLFHNKLQVGLARVITDRATYAYLGDVYVLEEHRGKGLSKWLLECVVSHPDLQGLRRFSLATRDAHSLYQRYGFTPLKVPDRMMEITRPDIYKQNSNI